MRGALAGRAALRERWPSHRLYRARLLASESGLALALMIRLADRLHGAESSRWRDLAGVLTEAEALGFAGLNVTYPFKQAVIPLLDELSPTAARLGAVNTVLFRGGGRLGDCTDGCRTWTVTLGVAQSCFWPVRS